MNTAATIDWQSWLACGLGLLAVLHLTRRWWPKRRAGPASSASPNQQANGTPPGSAKGCAVEAPSACGGGGCGACGTSTTPIRVHRRASRDTSGATPSA